MLPKVAYMDSFSGRNEIITAGSPTPQMIVLCPSCSTKFSVDSAAVSALPKPRFHCSRCDAVFGLSQSPSHAEHSAPEARKPTPVVNESKLRVALNVPPSDAASPTIKASDFSLSGSSEPLSVEQATQQISSTTPLQPSAPRSNQTRGWELFPVEAATTDHPSETSNDPDFDSPTTASRPLLHRVPEMSDMDPVRQVQPRDATTTHGKEEPPYQENRIAQAFTSLRPSSQGLILMTTPLIATLALLMVLSYSSRVSPVTIGAAARWLAPSFLTSSVPDLPPPGISVKGLNLTFTKTQTKEIIPVISGTVTNTTSETVNGVTLEALGFNDRGEVLITSQAPLRSALSREKIADLSLETIKKFQVSLSARKASIAPKEEIHFKIALLGKIEGGRSLDDSDLSELKYFSARVFSIK